MLEYNSINNATANIQMNQWLRNIKKPNDGKYIKRTLAKNKKAITITGKSIKSILRNYSKPPTEIH